MEASAFDDSSSHAVASSISVRAGMNIQTRREKVQVLRSESKQTCRLCQLFLRLLQLLRRVIQQRVQLCPLSSQTRIFFVYGDQLLLLANHSRRKRIQRTKTKQKQNTDIHHLDILSSHRCSLGFFGSLRLRL
jgi:hypothetical protein